MAPQSQAPSARAAHAFRIPGSGGAVVSVRCQTAVQLLRSVCRHKACLRSGAAVRYAMSARGRCRFRSVKSSQLTYLQSFGSRCTKDQCAACRGDCVVLSRSSYLAGQGVNHLESEKGGLQSEWSLLVKCLPRGVACHACSALPHVSFAARIPRIGHAYKEHRAFAAANTL